MATQNPGKPETTPREQAPRQEEPKPETRGTPGQKQETYTCCGQNFATREELDRHRTQVHGKEGETQAVAG